MAAVCGVIIPIEDVPDPVFSAKILGDVVAIEPDNGIIISPVAGSIISISETLHAYCIETDDGLELLVHIGVNTVQLKGKGFKPQVKVGDTVKVGTPLCIADLEVIKSANLSTITPVLITNMDVIQNFSANTGKVEAGTSSIIDYETKTANANSH